MKFFLRPTLLFLSFLIFCPASSRADTAKYISYFPIPYAEFTSLRLFPQSDFAAIFSGCSSPGQMYFEETKNIIYMCNKSTNAAIFDLWGYIPGVWNIDVPSSAISLNDKSSPELKKVGIGTYDPIAKLTLDIDAGILAAGTQGSGTELGYETFSAQGTQFLWYPRKAAIMAGSMGDQATAENRITRDDQQIGNYSAAFGIATFAASDYSAILAGAYTGVDVNSAHTTIITQGLPPGLNINSLYIDSQYSVLSSLNNEFSFPAGTYISQGNDYTFVAMGGGVLRNTDYSVALGYRTSIFSSTDADETKRTHFAFYGNQPELIYDVPWPIGEFLNYVGSSSYSTIFSATANIRNSQHGFIGTGWGSSIIDGPYNTILSGTNSLQETTGSTIMSGYNNSANDVEFTFIGGGKNNQARSDYSLVLGGEDNIAGTKLQSVKHTHAAVGGGQLNKAYAPGSFIGGGLGNIIGTPLTPECGDGTINGTEQCDGSDLGGATCLSVGGFPLGGMLACSPTCTLDTSGCIPCHCGDGSCDAVCGEVCDECLADCGPCADCGNGVLEQGEQCDGPVIPLTCPDFSYAAGDLECDDECKIDEGWCLCPSAKPLDPNALMCPEAFSEDHAILHTTQLAYGECTNNAEKDKCKAYCPSPFMVNETGDGCRSNCFDTHLTAEACNADPACEWITIPNDCMAPDTATYDCSSESYQIHCDDTSGCSWDPAAPGSCLGGVHPCSDLTDNPAMCDRQCEDGQEEFSGCFTKPIAQPEDPNHLSYFWYVHIENPGTGFWECTWGAVGFEYYNSYHYMEVPCPSGKYFTDPWVLDRNDCGEDMFDNSLIKCDIIVRHK